MKKLYCDMCGDEVEEHSLNITKLSVTQTNLLVGYFTKDYDLCANCYEPIAAIIKKGKHVDIPVVD